MPEDADPDSGLISVASPIGRAFVGKEAGDEVTAPTPAGVRHFEILKLVTIHDEELIAGDAAAPYSPDDSARPSCSAAAGTAGVYQAGVLQALAEAGVKIDVVAGHGAGVANALRAARSTAARGCGIRPGPWTSGAAARAYRWRAALRAGRIGLLAAGALLLSPLLRARRRRRDLRARARWRRSLNLTDASAAARRRLPAHRSNACSIRRSCRRSCRAPCVLALVGRGRRAA